METNELISFVLSCINYVQNCRTISGFARVSLDGQIVDAQVRQLADAGLTAIAFAAATVSVTPTSEKHEIISYSKPPATRVPFFDWFAGKTRGGLCDGAAGDHQAGRDFGQRHQNESAFEKILVR